VIRIDASKKITMIRRVDGEIKEYFGIPDELEVTQMLPIGYPKQFRAKSRKPLETFALYDHFDRAKLRRAEEIETLISNPRKLVLEIYRSP
jgi:hypothetical protein